VNLVFVPSAFNGDMDLFRKKAQWVWNEYANYTPFKQDISKLNVFYVTKGDNKK